MATPKPFKVDWHAAAVGEVLEGVRAYPWPIAPEVADGWGYGCDGGFLKRLCDHWTGGYDWRGAVADLNRFPQFTVRVEDFDLHFVHVVGEAGGKRPLLLSHGWPGSHYEFWGSIEKLAFPSRFGGKAGMKLIAELGINVIQHQKTDVVQQSGEIDFLIRGALIIRHETGQSTHRHGYCQAVSPQATDIEQASRFSCHG